LPADETLTQELTDDDVEEVLSNGALTVVGRLAAASNASFLGQVDLDGVSLPCIYKPVAGERPLWDFPDGTLAGRERAARLVSEAGSWKLVPPTVLREGRFGQGMCQRWIDVDTEFTLVDVVDSDFDSAGWIAVLQATDAVGRDVLLVHADDDRLRDMAVFDAVINNADRKGGHLLPEPSAGERPPRLWGCDHGVSFHDDTKLRTILWGWAGDPLRPQDRQSLARLVDALDDGLERELSSWLTSRELRALRARIDMLVTTGEMPVPDGSWPAIPWPAF
jgi:uncharacterized repeat protein (TIGR03843 family)